MLEARNVSFAYGDGSLAVSGVNLLVEPGERVVLLGCNGSGKSTLCRMLNGALAPAGGFVAVDGASDPRDLARLVGYVRQDPRNQVVSAQVFDEVAFGPRNLGLERSEVVARSERALEVCGIEALRDRMTSELSGGEQQLLALAGILAIEPRYLVLDEVGSQLDEGSRERVRTVVDELVRSGVGVVEISHGVESLFGAARVSVLAGGRVVWEGAPRAFLLSDLARCAAGLGDDELASLLSSAACAGWEPLERPDPTEVARYLAQREGPCEDAPYTPSPSHALLGSNLEVVYGDHAALDDVSLEARGLTLLLGPSGAGKTTVARVLAGVAEPDAGRALLDDAPVRAGRVGLAFQRPEDQLFCDTVLDDIAYGPHAAGMPDADGAARAAAALLGVGEELLNRSPLELSGGQMRRVALAGVIAARPAAYVLDEPSAGLDGPSRQALREVVRRLVDEGAAVLLITHDAADWLDCAGSVVLIRDGRVVGTVPAEKLASSAAPFRAAGLRAPLLVRLREAARGVGHA